MGREQLAEIAARISAAERRVKVSSKIFPGAMPPATSQATRCTKVAVLPVPAPARIRTAPSVVWAAWRCGGLSVARMDMDKY